MKVVFDDNGTSGETYEPYDIGNLILCLENVTGIIYDCEVIEDRTNYPIVKKLKVNEVWMNLVLENYNKYNKQ